MEKEREKGEGRKEGEKGMYSRTSRRVGKRKGRRQAPTAFASRDLVLARLVSPFDRR